MANGGGRRGHAAAVRAENRRCSHCNRSNALINWDASVRYCRWSREDKCDFTVEMAMKGIDDLREKYGWSRRFGTER